MERHSIANYVLGVLVLLLLLGLGVILLVFPRQIQRVGAVDRWGPLMGPTLGSSVMRKYFESEQFVWQLRLGGVLALISAAVVAYTLLLY